MVGQTPPRQRSKDVDFKVPAEVVTAVPELSAFAIEPEVWWVLGRRQTVEGGKGLGIETWLLRLGVSNQANMQPGIGEGVEIMRVLTT